MQFGDYKALIIIGFFFAFYLVLAFVNSAPFNENMLYSLFMYGLSILKAMPVFTGKPLIVPYSGTELLKGEESFTRGVFAVIFLFIAILGLSYVL